MTSYIISFMRKNNINAKRYILFYFYTKMVVRINMKHSAIAVHAWYKNNNITNKNSWAVGKKIL